MIHITDTMIEKIKEAVASRVEAGAPVEIPEMPGFFLLESSETLPEGVKRIVEIGIDGTKYVVYTSVEGGS